jgi:nucleotide-binding universal stress UspA family protein
VLVVPSAGRFEGPPEDVAVAWDASREAALALKDALPILHQAKRVTIVSFASADQHKGKIDEEDRVTLTRWLRQHGIQPVWDCRTTQIDIGDALLSCVSDLSADLIVMGGYGHSRWRERLLGGVTRDVLAHMTVPVLFAH